MINKIGISDHFRLDEFECPCCGGVRLDPELVVCLEKLRLALGRPLGIVSGYRCRPYHFALYAYENRQRAKRHLPPRPIPGQSPHLLGQAADIANLTITKDDLPMLKTCGFTGVGYGSGRAHVDVYPDRGQSFTTWEY